MAPTATERLQALGIVLPPPPKPAGTYAPVVVDGHRAYVSGQVVVRDGVAVSPGRVDADVSPSIAKDLTRTATLQALSALHRSLGSLDRVERVLRVAVYVASSEGFVRQHEVANGATELLVEVFGEAGRPARVSMGVASLPLNAPIEVELLAAIR
jgi:enamine deaminase RidA (YjgF/YER057c/UK114 family)